MELPFEITRQNGTQVASNGMVIITSDQHDSVMRRRRVARIGGRPAEMLYVELSDKTRVYVRQLDNGQIAVVITKQELYP